LLHLYISILALLLLFLIAARKSAIKIKCRMHKQGNHGERFMKTRLSGAVGDCFVSTSLILNIAQASLITKLTSKFLSFALLLIMAQAASAAPVIYSITSDNLVLNNPNGSWGGDLNTGAGQNVNLTVAYWYEGNPISNSAPNLPFHLIGKQVFDNTNGLASAFISGVGPSSLDILYDFSGVTDIFSTRIGER
jgi:hypothetical protein